MLFWGFQSWLCLIMVLMRMMNLRIAATMASLKGFPLVLRRSKNVRKAEDLERMAASVAM